MPSVADKIESKDISPLRILAYGKQKSRKTWWACAAAESNFNVLLLDGENGWDIAKNLSLSAQKRIQVIPLQEQTRRAIFAPFIIMLLKTGTLKWDLDKQISANLQPNSSCVDINLLNRTTNDILVLDSWTALVWSLQFRYAIENKIELSDAQKDEWDFYGWGGRLATWFLKQLITLPCNLIIIGHKTNFNKMSPKKKGKQQTILSTTEQLVSTSNPHSATIGTNFSDILTFTRISDMVTKIDTQGSELKEGGSRNVKPGIYNWEDLQFKDICLSAGIEIPSDANPLWDIDMKDMKDMNTGGSVTNANTNTVLAVTSKTNKLKLDL